MDQMDNSRGVLSDKNILHEKEKGNVIIDSFNEHNLSNCSYDVTLGENYYKPNSVRAVNPFSKKLVKEYWGKPLVAKKVTENLAKIYDINPDQKVITISPGQTILAHTNEFIGGKNNITTMMKARSSMGRANIAVCKSGGWGDIGYINRYTMDITNFTNATVVLPVGEKIAQIIFFYTGSTDKPYNGKYQISDDLKELKKAWKPSMMIP